MDFFSAGLVAHPFTTVERLHYIPRFGRITVEVNEEVRAGDVVGYLNTRGQLTSIDMARELDISPFDVRDSMTKVEGEPVAKGEVIAMHRALFGSRICRAPIDGIIERISSYTGRVMIRGYPVPVKSFISGTVAKVVPGEGVLVKGRGAYVQGIIGIGGEVTGEIVSIDKNDSLILTAEDIKPEHRSTVLVFNGTPTIQALYKAEIFGVRALVCGSIDKEVLDQFLGYSLGTAVTGLEPGLVLIITEGFGEIKMSDRVHRILSGLSGCLASCSGITRVRAGVKRPEIFVACNSPVIDDNDPLFARENLVRVLSPRYFGKLGYLQRCLQKQALLESEVVAELWEVELLEGGTITVPANNLELVDGKREHE